MPSPPSTQEARAAKYQGIVLVEATVTLDGRIENIKIIKSPGFGLEESVIQTMKSWRCKAATGPGGKPIPATVTFEISIH